MRLHRLRSVAAASCVLAALGAITLLAQYQVNRQIYGSGGASTGSVRYAPQYLGQQATGPSSTRLLPSEIRHAYVVSGALPSDIRMGQNRVGPLSPTGAIAYIPQAPNYRSSVGAMPQGNMINNQASQYNIGRMSMPSSSSPTSSWLAGPSAGSVRFSGMQSAPAPSMSTASPINAAPMGASLSSNPFLPSSMNGTIRYGG